MIRRSTDLKKVYLISPSCLPTKTIYRDTDASLQLGPVDSTILSVRHVPVAIIKHPLFLLAQSKKDLTVIGNIGLYKGNTRLICTDASAALTSKK